MDKAIKTLVNANFFHAAMTIAKTRFPPGHPMVADLYKQWAYQASQDGNYELAAKCWLAVDEFGQAAFRCGSCHLDRALNVGIVVEYRKIFIVFLCCCEMYLVALSRYRKGWGISLKNFQIKVEKI